MASASAQLTRWIFDRMSSSSRFYKRFKKQVILSTLILVKQDSVIGDECADDESIPCCLFKKYSSIKLEQQLKIKKEQCYFV